MYQARAEVTKRELEATIRATQEEIARSIRRVVRMPQAAEVPFVRNDVLIKANVEKLAEGRFDELKNGVKRYQLWVNHETGEIGAIGKFDEVGEIATDPSNVNIVVTETFGRVETNVALEKYLSPQARQAFLDTLGDFERSVPDVVASAPPPASLERHIAAPVQSV